MRFTQGNELWDHLWEYGVTGRFWFGLGRLAGLSLALVLSGCSTGGYWILNPQGPVAISNFHSLLIDVGAMMVIIGPTTLLVLWCIWRYRRSAGNRGYSPGWSHSLPIEIVSWGFPALIVAFLGYYSLRGTFAANPFGPGVIAPGTSAYADRPPLNIDVITTDWQWLFIYPDQHVASANELVVPVHTPVRFRLTSSTVTNDFFIPQLVGEIDIMPGMRTKQSMMANTVGTYEGYSTDFSGPGFSWMRFKTHVVTPDAFQDWVTAVSRAPDHLTQAVFNKFAMPTINVDEKTYSFSHIEPGMFDRVVAEVDTGKNFTTPRAMTDKSSYRSQGGRQPTHSESIAP